MMIAENTMVSLRYSVKNKQGDTIDNIMNGKPIEYLHGAGKILPELEEAVKGLKTGDQKSIIIENQLMANITEQLFIDVVIDDVRAARPEELQIGKPIQKADDKECGKGCCCG
jgi:FKBP-type peptidyl-prolyl cis-trans isomerase SlyD